MKTLHPFRLLLCALALLLGAFCSASTANAQVQTYSGYDAIVNVATASPGTGTPKTYDVGVGTAYPTLGSFNWGQLGPGDTMNIHPGTYHELILLTVRGTAAAPITIQGIPDAQGNLPVIDGQNATQDAQFAYNYKVFGSIGCITTYQPASLAKNGYKPGYLVIKNLELRNCYAGDEPVSSSGKYTTPPIVNTFTDYTGAVQQYHNVGAGFYGLTCDHITIEGCNIHGNGEGVFGAGQGGFDRYMAGIVLRNNNIWGNGNINSFTEHNSYLESQGVLYEGNHYGPERVGAAGSSLKDRSSGTIVRYNFIESSARILDMVESQNSVDAELLDPAYHTTLVYGNILAQDDPRCAYAIHYGGDQGESAYYRKGTLYFHSNTCYSTVPQSAQYKSTWFDEASAGESIDARNNIVDYAVPGGGAAPELDLLRPYGVGYFGVNWISASWHPCFSASPFTGVDAGMSNFIEGADPGFNGYPADVSLKAGSPALEVAGPLSGALSGYPVTGEYSP
ncbi:MAG TPA: hypothetical protein VFW40_11530 [Capsulimonadaceae bacterium]|nr:hypothetical protein [Capsulimonadaceae bacterium]